MSRKNNRQTRGRIISAAWKLFYENGYAETTIEDIIVESGTSRGSFYHYFNGKDALLGTLAYVFDEKYEELEKNLTEDMTTRDKLIYLNHELFSTIENGVSHDLISQLLATQLYSQSEKQLLDRNRLYFKLLKSIIKNGLKKRDFTTDMSAEDILHSYAMWERALLYDWCLSGGDYSLLSYTDRITPRFIDGLIHSEDSAKQ